MVFCLSAKNSPCLTQNEFFPLFKIQLATSLFQSSLAKLTHIIKRSDICTTSLDSYIDSVMIWLDILPANFQLTVTSSSQTTSSSFCFSWQHFLPAIYQMIMISSSHHSVSETAYEDKYPPKLSRVIFFVCKLLIISIENLFSSVSTNFRRDSF